MQEDLEHEVLNFYKVLLGHSAKTLRGSAINALRRGKVLSASQCRDLIRPLQDEEIMESSKSLGDLKAPGIDNFNAKFFKRTWEIVGKDVIRAVWYYFEQKKIDPAINCTLVALIPKTKNTMGMGSMRPISCCTTVYKIISKIITGRLSKVMNSIVNSSESVFVPGRNFHDNIIMAHELLKG